MESNNNNINNHANGSSTYNKEEEMLSVNDGHGADAGASVDMSAKEMSPDDSFNVNCNESSSSNKLFTLKKWNAIAMWSWDVDCDTCAICRVHVMDACLKCQSESKQDDCVVVWGECNHSFHNCCMSLWVQQSNRCPLCQQDWHVQRIGK